MRLLHIPPDFGFRYYTHTDLQIDIHTSDYRPYIYIK